jgi:exopolyphosphatase / guanosine-5'-triphosphate,3'-diphosphate pyrophosphatase
MRRAVVDIGTNTTRLYIAELEDGRISQELDRRTKVTRLGAGVDADGSLGGEAMQRVYDTLDDYRSAIDEHDVDEAVAVLTSATRDAANGEEFASSVQERYGLEPHILKGEEEARLTFLGATSDRDPESTTPTLVIDIGGGSTELVIGTGREAEFFVSTQAGVVRQSERHLHTDPPDASELDELAQDVRAIIADGVPEERRRAVEHAIAVAGTATSLAAIAQDLEPYDSMKVHGYVLRSSERDEIKERLAAMTTEERREVKGLDPARAPTIVAGIVILTEVMNAFGLDRVEVSEHDILRGAALGL